MSLTNSPTHQGGARRTSPLRGLAERSAEFEALAADERSGRVRDFHRATL